MLNSKISIILVSLFLTACASVPHESGVDVRTVTVEVPVPVLCKTPTPPAPQYCFSKVRKSDDIFVKTRCLLADRKKSIAYELELLTALETCK